MDSLFGLAGKYLVSHAISGETMKNAYICDHTSEDILIFGSSRAVHHYDPIILQDSLGLSCYNCAYDGCGSITAYGLLKILIQHYTPKVIIYDVAPGYDYLKSDKDNTKYLGPLKVYYDREGIDSIFVKSDSKEGYKMRSKMYRLNSQLIQMLSENIVKRNETVNGYLPENKKMQYEPEINEEVRNEYDTLKMNCLGRFVVECKQRGIKLVFYASPSYKKTNDGEFSYIKALSKKEGIPFVNHYTDSSFIYNKDYFFDSVHMNQSGATKYTQYIVSELRNFIRGN